MKLPVPFIQLPLFFDADLLAAEVNALEASLWQPHPSGLPGNTAIPLVASEGDPSRGDLFSGIMHPTPALARCHYLQQVLGGLGTILGRVRLMRLDPGAEVAPHVDTNHYWRERVRVHIPIVTDPVVLFTCGDAQVHMGEGECWIFDTWRLHRVVNPGNHARVHLVVDTIGSTAFGKLINAGRPHIQTKDGWNARTVEPGLGQGGLAGELMFESVNLMSPLSYWELREHVQFVLDECNEHPLLPVIKHYANEFVMDWRTLWFRYGADPEGLSEFRRVLTEFLARMQRVGGDILLNNHTQLASAFNGLLGQAVRGAGDACVGEEAARTSPLRTLVKVRPNCEFDRPVFIVSPPRSGSSLLFETLAQSPSASTIGEESHGIIEGNTASGVLGAAARGYDSNRLDAKDASPAVVEALRERFRRRAFNRNGERPTGRIRFLEKTPKNALRIPFFAEIFPDALFVYLYRDPREVLASMLEAWESGGFRSYPQLPGWKGLPWSMALTPGWRELIGQPLPNIVAAQWQAVTDTLLDDLAELPADSWISVRYDRILANPDFEVRRLCTFLGFEWDQVLGGGLPLASHTVSAPRREKWRQREHEVLPQLTRMAKTVARAEQASHHSPNGNWLPDEPRTPTVAK
ncbi:MAG: hypothetical protein EPN36_04955 [Rhodanobacteraceae bacterium]|nr:MAG: hypothetical protein EPN36_04955 [Rhodanobacteraceae bacterium]